MQNRDRGVLFAAVAQVLAVGVDEGGPVFRCVDQPVGFGDAGVALDRVQRQVEPAGALEQADPFVEQGVDLPPAFPRRRGLGPVGRRRADFGPAGAMRGDLFDDGFGEVVPQMPARSATWIAAGRARRIASDGIGSGRIPADDLHAGMPAQSGFQGVG
ncbi:hypothetical protein [Actinoplanes sp. NPDC026623]|uniref:hypothetical protein n=1 Tax=Actinoplanes sp. NPDC026623 TaxID=3155610 RepID=UPI0033D45163